MFAIKFTSHEIEVNKERKHVPTYTHFRNILKLQYLRHRGVPSHLRKSYKKVMTGTL